MAAILLAGAGWGNQPKGISKVAIFNKGEIKSGLKQAFWTAVGAVIFVAPLAAAYNFIRARVGMGM